MFEDGKTEPPWGLLSLLFPQFPEMLLQFGGQFCKPGGDDWTLVSILKLISGAVGYFSKLLKSTVELEENTFCKYS